MHRERLLEFDDHALADRILLRKEPVSQSLVDERDRRAPLDLARGRESPAAQGNLHGPEVAGRHAAVVGDHALARLDELRLDASVLGWSLVLSLLTGTAVGLAPALLWRGHLRPFGDASLRGAVGGTAARTIRRSLLVAEVALAIVLLVGAGLLVRSWWQLEEVDPGFRPERVLTMQLGAPVLMTPAQRANFYRVVLERIESLPGVERAGFISDAFIISSPERTLTTERDGEAVSARLQFRSDEIGAGLFQALGARLLDGRLFTPRDGPESPRV